MNIKLADSSVATGIESSLKLFKDPAIKDFFVTTVEKTELSFSVMYERLARSIHALRVRGHNEETIERVQHQKNSFDFYLKQKTNFIALFQTALLRFDAKRSEEKKLESNLDMQFNTPEVKELMRTHSMEKCANEFESNICNLIGSMKVELRFIKAARKIKYFG